MSDHVDGGDVDKQASQQRVRQLERQLDAVERERDDLERDVEQLCMSRGGHMFSSSYVLSERLKFLEAEVKQQRVQLRTITAEKDSLQEDIQTIKASKRQADQGWQAERQNTSALEQQVNFFQTSSAKAIADRDSAAYEAQYLKSQLSAATSALRESQALLTSVQQQCREQQQQISNTQQQLVSARNELTQCKGQLKAMATLQQQLAQQREVAKQVQAELDHSQAEHKAAMAAAAAAAQSGLRDAQGAAADLRGQLADAQERSRKATVQHREDKAELQKKLSVRSVALDDAQRLLEQTSAALLVSQAALKEQHAERKHRRNDSAGHAGVSALNSTAADSPQSDEIKRLEAAVADAEDSLQRAARDQVDVLNELAHLQAMHDEHESVVQQLTGTNNELKSKLAQATQDKVQALLQLAQQEQISAASGAQPLGIPSQQQRQQKQQQTQWKQMGLGFLSSTDAAATQHSPSTCSTHPPSPATGAFMRPAVLQNKTTTGNIDSTVKAPVTPNHATAVAATKAQPADIAANTGGGDGLSRILQAKANLTGAVASSALADSQQQQQQEEEGPSPALASPTAIAAIADTTSSTKQPMVDHLTQQASPASPFTFQPESEHQLVQQLQQHLHDLQLLLLFAHHYRSSLETLQPGAINAAAAGNSSNGSSATQDPVTRLNNIVQEIETCRKHFSRSNVTTQQHDLLVEALLQGSSSTSTHSPASRLAEIFEVSHSSISSSSSIMTHRATKQDSGLRHTGLVSGLGKLLSTGGHKSSSTNASAMSKDKHNGSTGSSSGFENKPACAVCNSSLSSLYVCMSQLEAGIAWEVQLLADLCVAALRHVHKVTALSNLMQDTW